jgi:hypothetical protein
MLESPIPDEPMRGIDADQTSESRSDAATVFADSIRAV